MDTSDDPAIRGTQGSRASDQFQRNRRRFSQEDVQGLLQIQERGRVSDIGSPDAKKRKVPLAQAATLTRDWLPPTLGTPGLLGLT